MQNSCDYKCFRHVKVQKSSANHFNHRERREDAEETEENLCELCEITARPLWFFFGFHRRGAETQRFFFVFNIK